MPSELDWFGTVAVQVAFWFAMVQAFLALRSATKPKRIGTMTQWVYTFGDGKAEGDAGMKNLLGGKGANLAEMSNLGLPVPPGLTITTEACTYYYAHKRSYPPDLKEQVSTALREIGYLAKGNFGDPDKP